MADDEANFSLSGTDVDEWFDTAPSPVTLTPAGTKPTRTTGMQNGLAGVTLQELVTTSTPAKMDNIWDGGGHVFVVAKGSAGGGNTFVLQKGSNFDHMRAVGHSGGLFMLYFSRKFSGDDGVWRSTEADVSIADVSIFEVEYDADSAANNPILRVDGAAETITEAATPTGSSDDDSANETRVMSTGWQTATFEVIIYSAILSADDATIVREYLADKWGLTLP